jgi:hypothetical protein
MERNELPTLRSLRLLNCRPSDDPIPNVLPPILPPCPLETDPPSNASGGMWGQQPSQEQENYIYPIRFVTPEVGPTGTDFFVPVRTPSDKPLKVYLYTFYVDSEGNTLCTKWVHQ